MNYSDPRFWLSVSFSIFFVLVLKYIMPKIISALDKQSNDISSQILAAKNMREEAEELLKTMQQYHRDSLIYCQKLVEDAKNEAQKFLINSQKSLEEEISKKLTLAKERIDLEEKKTIREIKIGIVDAAIKAFENKAGNFSKKSSSNLVQQAIDDISKIIH